MFKFRAISSWQNLRSSLVTSPPVLEVELITQYF